MTANLVVNMAALQERQENSDSEDSSLSDFEVNDISDDLDTNGLGFDTSDNGSFFKSAVSLEADQLTPSDAFCVLDVQKSVENDLRLPWERFAEWLECICVVTFDLEIGQMIENVYPSAPHICLSEQDKTNICYLSFPDSNSGCMGDTQFHFRIRRSPGNSLGTLSPLQAHAKYNQNCPPSYQVDPAYLWGYVYFRQTKDRTLRRGYFQKSLVLISKLPFIELFRQISGIISPEFFETGPPILEASCREIDKWPSPVPGETLYLPLLGSLVQIRIPCASSSFGLPSPDQRPTSGSSVASPQRKCKSVTGLDLFSALSPLLSHLHMLWELILCGEPMVVMATSPDVCSHVVQSLVSLIEPLQYCNDYRPFFTIHNSELKDYTSRSPSQTSPAVLLGVTNPFFAKALQHWPHIIRMADVPGSSTVNSVKVKLRKLANPKMDSKPGVYTAYKPCLQRDKTVLKKLAKGVQTRRPNEVQSAIIRRHFLELTQSFIIPLERYVARLMPLQKTISPYKAVPVLRPFKEDDFLAALEHCGPQLTTGVKGDWYNLYQRFLKSSNFKGWYQRRLRDANRKLQALQMEALSQSDLKSWLHGKQEVEVVDMVLRLKDKIDTASTEPLPISEETRLHLQGHLETAIQSLPDDLRSVLKA